MLIGYARGEPHDQTLTLQKDVLQNAGCHTIFTDSAGGGKTNRTGLDKTLASLRPGDTLVVWKLDRLGTSIKELIRIMTALSEQGIGFQSLADRIDTTANGGKQVYKTFTALRGVLKAKTTAGLQVARAKGRKGGRPKTLTPEEVTLLQELYNNKEVSIPEICQQLKISKMTLYRYVKHREPEKPYLRGFIRQLTRRR